MKSIGVDVVAEGLEEQKQIEMLRDLECELAEGYTISKPIDGQAATRPFIQQPGADGDGDDQSGEYWLTSHFRL